MIQFSARGGVDVIEWIGKKEWYQLPLSAKIESLRFLVDLVCTSPVARSHIDGLEEQLRSCYASEKEEIAAKKKIMTKLARNKAGSGKSGGGADSDSDSDDGKDGTVPAEFDHLFVRDDTQLQHMELDHCDICLQGGKLVLCDGDFPRVAKSPMPGLYLARPLEALTVSLCLLAARLDCTHMVMQKTGPLVDKSVPIQAVQRHIARRASVSSGSATTNGSVRNVASEARSVRTATCTGTCCCGRRVQSLGHRTGFRATLCGKRGRIRRRTL